MSKYRILSYQDKENQEGEKLFKQINDHHKEISQKLENRLTNSNAIYRISPILTYDKNNISYPLLKVTQNEYETIERNLKEDYNDLKNENFLSKINLGEREKELNTNEENKENLYEVKIPDEDDIKPRAPLDRNNLVRSFCITMDTYNNRVVFDDEDEDEPDVLIENLEEKLKNLFDI
jgi:hypothetical protein